MKKLLLIVSLFVCLLAFGQTGQKVRVVEGGSHSIQDEYRTSAGLKVTTSTNNRESTPVFTVFDIFGELKDFYPNTIEYHAASYYDQQGNFVRVDVFHNAETLNEDQYTIDGTLFFGSLIPATSKYGEKVTETYTYANGDVYTKKEVNTYFPVIQSYFDDFGYWQIHFQLKAVEYTYDSTGNKVILGTIFCSDSIIVGGGYNETIINTYSAGWNIPYNNHLYDISLINTWSESFSGGGGQP